MSYSIAQINQMSHDVFVETFGAIFEQTPAIAHEAWTQRPFTDVADLHQAMVDILSVMTPAERLALLRAHPDLGSKAKMAEASVQEQAGAGLDHLMPTEDDRFQSLNQAYKEKFGFPFIVAVKEQTKVSILDVFERRLQHSPEAEINQALAEIATIAHFRLLNLIAAS